MTKSKQRKLKMAMMIGFAVLSTTSLAVSSFAWFITRRKATFEVSQLTVISPDAFSFYAYRGNPVSSYNPEASTGDLEHPNKTFEDDFIALDQNTPSATRDEYLSFNGMYPGKAMTFAFKLVDRTAASLSITKLTSNDATMQGIKGTDNNPQPRYISNYSPANTSINVGWAMNIYVTTLTVDHGYTSFVNDPSNDYEASDLFRYDETSENSAYHRANYLAGNVSSNVVTLSNPIPLFSSSSLSGTTYVFFSVMFSDESSTYFEEVNGNSGTATPVTEIPTTGTRYFRKSVNGNSNCYSNLKFAINELRLV